MLCILLFDVGVLWYEKEQLQGEVPCIQAQLR